MATLEYSIKIKAFRLPRRIKKALEKGRRYKVEFTQRKHSTGVDLTPNVRLYGPTH